MDEYQQAKLEPFKPRQCMHWSSDGIRCRAYARHNEYTCFHHRIPEEPSIPVIHNEPFTLPSLKTRDGVFEALDAVAAHLAGKTIDDRRARLLLHTIQLATYQHPRPIPAPPGTLELGAPGSTASPSTLGIPTEDCPPTENRRPSEDCPPTEDCHSDPEPAEGEEPPHFAPAQPDAATEPPVPQPPREYTDEEQCELTRLYLIDQNPALADEVPAPLHPSLTHEDVEAYFAFRKARSEADQRAEKKARNQNNGITLQSVAAQPATDNLQPATSTCSTAASNKPSPHLIRGTAAPLPGTLWSGRSAAPPSPAPGVSGAASRGTAGTPPRIAACRAGRTRG